jgi:hypothetical protein
MGYKQNQEKMTVSATGKASNATAADTATISVSVCARRTTSIALPSDTHTPITGLTEFSDLLNLFNPTTGIFTAPSTGNYLIELNGNAVMTNVNGTFNIYIYKNNSLSAFIYSQSGAVVGINSTFYYYIPYPMSLTANDTIRIYLEGQDYNATAFEQTILIRQLS